MSGVESCGTRRNRPEQTTTPLPSTACSLVRPDAHYSREIYNVTRTAVHGQKCRNVRRPARFFRHDMFVIYFASAAVAVDSSRMIASSSASWSRFSPPSNFFQCARAPRLHETYAQYTPPRQTRQNSPVCVVSGVAVWIRFYTFLEVVWEYIGLPMLSDDNSRSLQVVIFELYLLMSTYTVTCYLLII